MSNENQGWQPKIGDEGYERAKEYQEEQRSKYGPSRFFLKPGQTAKLTFLDSAGFYNMEHSLKINGKWGHFFTCRSEFSECPLCDSPTLNSKPSYVCAYTVIDHTGYVDNNGKEHKNIKRLLVVKPRVMDKLARRKQSMDGDLTFGCFDVSRDSPDECSTGEDFSFLKRLTVDDLAKIMPTGLKNPDGSPMTVQQWLQPFDYMTLFAPKSVEELRRIAGTPQPVGAGSIHAGASPASRAGSSVPEQSIEDLL